MRMQPANARVRAQVAVMIIPGQSDVFSACLRPISFAHDG
jgi:hypothetical protein